MKQRMIDSLRNIGKVLEGYQGNAPSQCIEEAIEECATMTDEIESATETRIGGGWAVFYMDDHQ